MHKLFAVFAAVFVMISSTSFAVEAQPNILWLSTEDIGPELACYGDKTAKTPNIDALAKKGVDLLSLAIRGRPQLVLDLLAQVLLGIGLRQNGDKGQWHDRNQ